MIMFPQVNRQYLCLPNLNTLNVLLGTLNQVWRRITVSSLLHKQVLFSLFKALTENRSFYLQDWIFQTSRMATGGYEAATSMIHRRRAPVKRGENRIGSKLLVRLFVLYKRFVSTQQRVNFWPVENSWLFLVWFKLHFPALKPLFVLMTWCVAVSWQWASMGNKGFGVGEVFLHGHRDTLAAYTTDDLKVNHLLSVFEVLGSFIFRY